MTDNKVKITNNKVKTTNKIKNSSPQETKTMDKVKKTEDKTPVSLIINNSLKRNLVIPKKVEEKIRFMCNKIGNVEWSGVLFYKVESKYKSFEKDPKSCFIIEDFLLMDIGSGTYTEYEMNTDLGGYIADHPELALCCIGNIHSHNVMNAFFSSTDTNTLKEYGNDYDNFLSLIVNNAGTYCAAITVRSVVKEKVDTFIVKYFFGERIQSSAKPFMRESIVVEYANLNIIKEEAGTDFPELTNRIEELKQQAIEEKKKEQLLKCKQLTARDSFYSGNLQKDRGLFGSYDSNNSYNNYGDYDDYDNYNPYREKPKETEDFYDEMNDPDYPSFYD